jgi:hypothetical protein
VRGPVDIRSRRYLYRNPWNLERVSGGAGSRRGVLSRLEVFAPGPFGFAPQVGAPGIQIYPSPGGASKANWRPPGRSGCLRQGNLMRQPLAGLGWTR